MQPDRNGLVFTIADWLDSVDKEKYLRHHILTSPAPWKRNVLSANFVPVILMEAKTPAAATDAVPVKV